MTPTEQKRTLCHLVEMRHAARLLIKALTIGRENVATLKRRLDVYSAIGNTECRDETKAIIEEAKERLMEIKFKMVELGHDFNSTAHHYDQLPREAWLRALGVNESEWDTPDMRKYGQNISAVVNVIDLENSATRDYATIIKPLKWCCTLAMMNLIDTNPKFWTACPRWRERDVQWGIR